MTNKQKYTYLWLALSLIILSATFLLLVSALKFNLNYLHGILSILSWTLIMASGIFLFLIASERTLKNLSKAVEDEEEEVPRLTQKPSSSKTEKEDLDIHGIAKKIVRRVNPDENSEKWGADLLKHLVSEIEIMSGIFYINNGKNKFDATAVYAYPRSNEPFSFEEGEGLTGQVAKNRQVAVYRSIPEDYKEVFSGLGKGKPSYIAIFPIVVNDLTKAIIEVAGFKWSDAKLEQLFQIISQELAEKILVNQDE